MFQAPRATFDYSPIHIAPATGLSADQIVLLGDIRSLEAKVIQRQLWSAPSVRELLQAAADTTLSGNDVEKARAAFAKAEKVFQDDVQTKNRMFYLLGAFLGTLAMALVTWVVLGTANRLGLGILASPDTVISLFTFAGLGSAASVLSRLSTIDLKDELRKKWVVISAGTRPLLAIAFASIVYVILKNNLVTIHGFEEDSPAKSALIWTAAFLCGFSERFAVDLLDRLPFARPDSDGAPASPQA